MWSCVGRGGRCGSRMCCGLLVRTWRQWPSTRTLGTSPPSWPLSFFPCSLGQTWTNSMPRSGVSQVGHPWAPKIVDGEQWTYLAQGVPHRFANWLILTQDCKLSTYLSPELQGILTTEVSSQRRWSQQSRQPPTRLCTPPLSGDICLTLISHLEKYKGEARIVDKKDFRETEVKRVSQEEEEKNLLNHRSGVPKTSRPLSRSACASALCRKKGVSGAS